MWYETQPAKWYQLVSEMEAFRQRSGWSLAETWGRVHRGDYEAARRRFDDVKARFHDAHGAVQRGVEHPKPRLQSAWPLSETRLRRSPGRS
jgi:hypothetical protein